MGKREALIVVAFVLAGVVAYQLTASPPKPGQTGFSLARLWTTARRQVQANAAHAVVVVQGTMPLRPGVTDISVSKIQQTVQIIGEARTDIAFELTVESNGPDEPTAREWAGRSILKPDDLGSTLAVQPVYPPEGLQSGRLRLRVPRQMNVRVDGSTGVRASGIAAVRLEQVVGDVNIENITGAVKGSQRNGNLTVTGAAGGTLTLNNSTATFERLTDRLTLTTRGSHCRISGETSAIDLDTTNTDVSISAPHAPVHVSGSGGSVTIDGPRAEIDVEVRNAEVEVTLGAPVAMTLVTTDDTLRVLVAAGGAGAFDAIASDGGQLQAGEFNLRADESGGERRLTHIFGASPNPPRVVLRNQRGDMVIRKAK